MGDSADEGGSGELVTIGSTDWGFILDQLELMAASRPFRFHLREKGLPTGVGFTGLVQNLVPHFEEHESQSKAMHAQSNDDSLPRGTTTNASGESRPRDIDTKPFL